jgi:hypothetical protein
MIILPKFTGIRGLFIIWRFAVIRTANRNAPSMGKYRDVNNQAAIV